MKIFSPLKYFSFLFVFGFTSLLYAVDTFDYARYPASAMKDNNSTCFNSNVTMKALYVKTPGSSQYTLVPSENNSVFAPGNTIKAIYQTSSEECRNQPISLALYSAEEGDPLRASLQTERQLLVASSTERLFFGGDVAVYLQIPASFCGPYQIDSVLGKPLPMIGHDRSFYHSIYRYSSNLPMSDARDMIVNFGYRGMMSGGMCKNFTTTTFPSLAATPFNYANYPANQNLGTCTTTQLSTFFPMGGFSVNGVPTNDLSNLKANDSVTFNYRANSSQCTGKTISMSFYRNPNGPNGYFGQRTQSLIVKDVQSMYGNGSTRSLSFVVPSYFTGGWQLDIALGNPLPIVGDLGSRYNALLLIAAKGMM